jgi:chitin synthase
VEKAAADGDDLNVVPETFKQAALDAQNSQVVKTSVPLLPPDRLDGRFAAAERLPGGWYQQQNDSMVSTNIGGMAGPSRRHQGRNSFDSYLSVGTSNNSVYMPRRVESIMGEEDRKKYAMAQASQREAGGAYFEPPRGRVYEISEAELKHGGWKESSVTLDSYQDPSDHQGKEIEAAAEPSASPSPPEPALGGVTLTVPARSASANQNRRSGRSPLARASLVRTASSEDIELHLPQSRPHSTERGLGDSR